MDRHTRCASDCAYCKGLRCDFRCAVVARRDALFDDLDLAIETCGPAFNERNVGRKAHLVDMASRIDIVERIEDDVELCEPFDVELGILDVCMVCFKLYVWVELLRYLLRDLCNVSTALLLAGHAAYKCFGLLNMLMSEEELSVQVAEVDGVKVDNVYLAEAAEKEVLE